MGIVASAGTTIKRKLITEDVHRGVCDMIVDLGVQKSQFYDPKHQVYIRFALPDETISIDGEEKPMVCGKFYTLSLHEKANLRKDTENWRGKRFTEAELKGFDLKQLLGAPCMIQIVHNDEGTRDNISGISKLPKGMAIPTLGEMNIDGLLYEGGVNGDHYDRLPQWLQKKVGEQMIEGEATDSSRQLEGFDKDIDPDKIPF
jgi:hypothetical protein